MSQEQDNPDIEEAKAVLLEHARGATSGDWRKAIQFVVVDHNRLSRIVEHVKQAKQPQPEWLDFNCPQCGTQNYIDDSDNKNDKICKCWFCGKYFTWDNDIGIYLTEPNDNAAKGMNTREAAQLQADTGDEAEKWMLSILRSFAASRVKPVQEKLQSMIPASFYGDRDLETRLVFLVNNWKALGNAADRLRRELEEAKSKLNPCYDEAGGTKMTLNICLSCSRPTPTLCCAWCGSSRLETIQVSGDEWISIHAMFDLGRSGLLSISEHDTAVLRVRDLLRQEGTRLLQDSQRKDSQC